MKRSGSLFFLILIMVSAACSTLRKSGSSPPSGYSENITGLRPTYADELNVPREDTIETNDNSPVEVEPQQDVTQKLDEMLAGIIKNNEEIDYVTGYTIQVYSGASRENANMVKAEIYRQLPDSRPKEGWVAPNYKVTVGIFLEKIEAQKFYSELKQHFPQAILIPTRIPNTFPLSKH